MPLPKTVQRVPTAIGAVRINLGDLPTGARKMTYNLEVLDAGGQVLNTLTGDLTPHLTAGQLNAINNFLDAMRIKAQEALP